MSGGLVMLGAFTDGDINIQTVIFSLITGLIIALRHFQLFWDRQKV